MTANWDEIGLRAINSESVDNNGSFRPTRVFAECGARRAQCMLDCLCYRTTYGDMCHIPRLLAERRRAQNKAWPKCAHTHIPPPPPPMICVRINVDEGR